MWSIKTTLKKARELIAKEKMQEGQYAQVEKEAEGGMLDDYYTQMEGGQPKEASFDIETIKY